VRRAGGAPLATLTEAMAVARALQTGASDRVVVPEQLTIADIAADHGRVLWPVWFIVARSETPLSVAEVAGPARKLWPAKTSGIRAGAFGPALHDRCDRPRSDKRHKRTPPPGSSCRNSGP
jgi:hypothetical protein